MSGSVAPSTPSLQTTSPPPRRLPEAPAGTQQVPFQFAVHSGVRYSHGKSSLPWRCEPPNPETRPGGQILPREGRLASPAPGPRPALWEKGLGSRFFALGGRRGRQSRTLGKREREGRQIDKVLLKARGHSALSPRPPGLLSPVLSLVLGGDVTHSVFVSTASKNRGAFFKVSGTKHRVLSFNLSCPFSLGLKRREGWEVGRDRSDQQSHLTVGGPGRPRVTAQRPSEGRSAERNALRPRSARGGAQTGLGVGRGGAGWGYRHVRLPRAGATPRHPRPRPFLKALGAPEAAPESQTSTQQLERIRSPVSQPRMAAQDKSPSTSLDWPGNPFISVPSAAAL